MGANFNGAALIGQFYAERNREYPLGVPLLSVGRSSENSLRIRDERIAERHVRIVRHDTAYVLEVTAVDAPTWLNGSLLKAGERRPLTDGDLIGLSEFEFRFVVPEATTVLCRLWVVGGVHRGKTFRIERSTATVGRAIDNDVQFPDRSVSRHHCLIRRDGEAWWIQDQGSTNGTLMKGIPITEHARLRHGDEIVAGFSRFVFQEGDRPIEQLRLDPLPSCN